MEKKNKKPLIFVSLLLIVLFIVGVTIAYYTSSDTFNNEFNTGTYKMVVQENFISPDNWTPGDTTPKTVTATNKGSVPAAVRIKLTPSWTDKNGDPLSLTDEDDNEVALINFASGWDSNWIYSNGYYYYNGSLDPNEVTPSLIDSVTFNGEASIDSQKTCTEDPTTHKTKCTTRATGYAGGKYTLTVDIETVQYDKYQEVWGTNVEMDEKVNEPKKLYEIIQSKAKMDNVSSTYVSSSNGIDYSQNSSDTNGKGVYTISSTVNDDYPIMFYRGDVKNNNLTFADQCFKIVRTTDTGGTKILYNGNAVKYRKGLSKEDYTISTDTFNNMTYDSVTTLWKYVLTGSTGSDTMKFTFKVPEDDDYVFTAQFSSYGISGASASGGTMFIKKNGTQVAIQGGGGGYLVSTNYDAGHLTANDEISFEYGGAGNTTNPIKIYIQMYKSGSEEHELCGGTMEFLFHQLSYTNSTISNWSPEVVGYMSGKGYILESGNYNAHSTEYFGSDVTYQNDKYKLVNPALGRSTDRLYTCYSTDPDGECTEVYYYAQNYWYVKFQDGDNINTLYYNLGESTLKGRIDYIYYTYLENYTNYLEDTPFCNDRSGNLYLYSGYNAETRVNNGTPSLTCSKNDSFTVSNNIGNQALTYPVGTLTVDELMYAGLTKNDNNENNYLNMGYTYWTMTPNSYNKDDYGKIYTVNGNGKIDIGRSKLDNNYYSRAVVSLKPNTMIVSGNGTLSNPYKVAQ